MPPHPYGQVAPPVQGQAIPTQIGQPAPHLHGSSLSAQTTPTYYGQIHTPAPPSAPPPPASPMPPVARQGLGQSSDPQQASASDLLAPSASSNSSRSEQEEGQAQGSMSEGGSMDKPEAKESSRGASSESVYEYEDLEPKPKSKLKQNLLWILLFCAVMSGVGYAGYRFLFGSGNTSEDTSTQDDIYKVEGRNASEMNRVNVRESTWLYAFSASLTLLRSQPSSEPDDILEKLPYGTRVLFIGSHGAWSEVEALGKRGYIASYLLMNEEDFRILEALFWECSPEVKNTLTDTGERRALVHATRRLSREKISVINLKRGSLKSNKYNRYVGFGVVGTNRYYVYAFNSLQSDVVNLLGEVSYDEDRQDITGVSIYGNGQVEVYRSDKYLDSVAEGPNVF